MTGEVSLIIQCVVTGRLLFRVSSYKTNDKEHSFPSFKVKNPLRVSSEQGTNLIRNATNADEKLFHSFSAEPVYYQGRYYRFGLCSSSIDFKKMIKTMGPSKYKNFCKSIRWRSPWNLLCAQDAQRPVYLSNLDVGHFCLQYVQKFLNDISHTVLEENASESSSDEDVLDATEIMETKKIVSKIVDRWADKVGKVETLKKVDSKTEKPKQLLGVHIDRIFNGRYSVPVDPSKALKVGIIIRCTVTGRYLLVFGAASGMWSFPKGHVNKNDGNDLRNTGIRECSEEAGITISKESLNPTQVVLAHRGATVYFTTTCDSTSRQFHNLKTNDCDEVSEVAWIDQKFIDQHKYRIANSDVTNFMHTAAETFLMPKK